MVTGLDRKNSKFKPVKLCLKIDLVSHPACVELDKYVHCTKHREVTQLIDVQGSLNKFPDFFRMGTFIDSTLMKL